MKSLKGKLGVQKCNIEIECVLPQSAQAFALYSTHGKPSGSIDLI